MRRFTCISTLRAFLATLTLALTVGVVPGFVPGTTPEANAGVVGADPADTMGFRADQIEAAVYYPALTRGQESTVIAIDVDDDGNVYSATNWAIQKRQGGDLQPGAGTDIHEGYEHKWMMPRVIVHKVDPDGEQVWSWELNGRGYDAYPHFDEDQNDRTLGDIGTGYGGVTDIVVDDDGNTYVTGMWIGDGVTPEDRQQVDLADNDISVHTKIGSDGWVASIDPDGNTRWVKVLHSWGNNYGTDRWAGVNGWAKLNAVDVDNNGSVVVAGRFNANIYPNMDNTKDHPVPATGASNTGDIHDWRNDPPTNDACTVDPDCVTAGFLWDSSHHSETIHSKSTSPYVAKLDAATGSHQWHFVWNTCSANEASAPADVKFLSDGDIVTVGGYNFEARYQQPGEDCSDRSLDGQKTQGMTAQYSQVLEPGDGARSNIVKLSGDGDFMWGREFGSTNNLNAATGLAVDPNNDDLYIVGLWELWHPDDADFVSQFPHPSGHSNHYMAPSTPANHADHPDIPNDNNSLKPFAQMFDTDHESQPPEHLLGFMAEKPPGTCVVMSDAPCTKKQGRSVNQDTYLLHTDKHGNYILHETYDVHGVKEDKPAIDINRDGTELVIAGTGLPQCSAFHSAMRREAAGWVMTIDLETTLPESFRDFAPLVFDTNLSAKWTTITEPDADPVPSFKCLAGIEMKNASNRWRDVAFGPDDNVYVGGGWYNQVKFGEVAAGEEVISHTTLPKDKADAVVVRYNTEGNIAGLAVPPLPYVAQLGYGIVTGPTLPEVGFSSVVNGTTPNDGSLGFTVTQSEGSTVVAETGTTDTFTVVLKAQPPRDAKIFLCLCMVIGEVSLDKITLTFTPDNWDEPQTVTVTGLDEDVDDGNSGSLVTLAPVNGTSDEWSDVPNQTFMVTNVDNDVLAPGAEVIWNEPLCKGGRWEVTPQPGIAVRQYMILKDDVTAPNFFPFSPVAGSGDAVAEWVRANHNNGVRSVPNYNILWQDGFLLDEDGGTSTWPETFKLRGWDVGVTDLDDASDRPVGFYFRNGVFTYNTNSSATVFPTSYGPSSEVSGHSWDLDDYDVYLAFAHPEGSTNHQIYPQFEQKGCEPGPFVLCSGTSFDCDDTYGFTVSKDDVTTTEEGGSESFTVCLTGPTYMGFDGPSADVFMSVENTDSTEVELSTDSLVFTPDNWDDCQTITVTGLDDGEADGDATSYVNIVIDHDDSSYEYAAIPNDFVTVLNENVDLLPPPPNPDIDGDGIINEDEVDGCVDKADCDGDGINDGNEIFACMLAADCDGDGVGDNEEISQACIQDPSCTETINNPVDDLPVVVDPDPVDPDPQDPPDEPVIDTPDEIDDPQDPLDLVPDDQEDPDDQEEIDDLPLDTDGDGVPDDQEEIGCESNPDCDGDGIGDKDDEDPANPDRDNDGLPDGSDPDPTNPDSDGDGIPDGEDSDADGDGEVDCPACDTDGDGIVDGNDPDNSDLVNPGGSIPGIEPDAGPDEPAPPSDTDDTDDEAPPPVQTPDAKSPGRGLADRLGDLPLAAVAAAAALAIAAAAAAAASLAGPSLLSWLFRGSLGVWLFGLLFGRRGVRCSSCDLKLVKQAGMWVDKDTQWVVGINNHTHVPADFSDKDRDKYVTAVQQILQRRDP